MAGVAAAGCNNSITNHRIGIHASGKTNLNIGVDQNGNSGTLYKNIITYNLGDPPFLYDPHYGIFLQYCPGARVVSNEISNNNVVTSGITNFRGIDVTASTDLRINCNTITNLPRSMNFMGNCDGALLRSNVMTEYDEGIHLEGATLPDQFQVNDQTGTQEPMNNLWNDGSTGNGNPTDRVTGTISGSPINWYYRNDIPSPTPFDPLDAGMTSLIIASVPYNPGIVACNDFSNRQSREQKFGAAVGDSLQFSEYENENSYYTKENAFKAMKSDSAILYQGTATDASFQLFYADMENSNIGVFDSVAVMAADSNSIAAAAILNSAVVDTNDIEYFKKSVNDIYLNTVASDLPLSASDSLWCDYVSSLSYFTAGSSIFTAAALLGKEIHPVYYSLRKASPELTGIKNKHDGLFDVLLFPNPAKESIAVKLSAASNAQIRVYDFAGKFLFEKEILAAENSISVKGLANGLYRIAFILPDGTREEKKFVIIH